MHLTVWFSWQLLKIVKIVYNFLNNFVSVSCSVSWYFFLKHCYVSILWGQLLIIFTENYCIYSNTNMIIWLCYLSSICYSHHHYFSMLVIYKTSQLSKILTKISHWYQLSMQLCCTVLKIYEIYYRNFLVDVFVPKQRIYNYISLFERTAPPPPRLPLEALSQPLSTLSAVYCTTCPSV